MAAAKFFWVEDQEYSLNTITSLADEARSLKKAVHFFEESHSTGIC